MEREQEQRRLYLILDDSPHGYSIREISLSPPSCRRRSSSSSSKKRKRRTKKTKNTTVPSGKAACTDVPVQCLPEPIIILESELGLPKHFAAVGTRILFTQCLNRSYSLEQLDYHRKIMPVVDVRTRCVTFGPGGDTYPVLMSLPVAGGELFVHGPLALSKLSFNPHWPPPLDDRSGRIDDDDTGPWAWHQLPSSLFEMAHLTSYAVDADGQTVVFSADSFFCAHTDDPYDDADDPPATFAFDTRASVWERRRDWALPFAGRAFFLGALVGLSKDPATSGHLVSCEPPLAADTGGPPAAWKLGKEKLFSEDPAETRVSATLVYTGRGGGGGDSEFCLVQCVSVKHGSNNGNNSVDRKKKKLDEEEPRRPGYRYRLTTFSVSYDSNGDLTTGQTCRVQCYEVPRETTQMFINFGNPPVAFWL